MCAEGRVIVSLPYVCVGKAKVEGEAMQSRQRADRRSPKNTFSQNPVDARGCLTREAVEMYGRGGDANRGLEVRLGAVHVVGELQEQVTQLHARARLGQGERVHTALVANGFVALDSLQRAVVLHELPCQTHERVDLGLRVNPIFVRSRHHNGEPRGGTQPAREKKCGEDLRSGRASWVPNCRSSIKCHFGFNFQRITFQQLSSFLSNRVLIFS